MSSTLFLKHNPIDNRWKVLDADDFAFGDGASPKEAIQSARIVTGKAISLGSNQEISDGDFNKDELIEALSELAGMKIIECFDDELNPTGYKMELIE